MQSLITLTVVNPVATLALTIYDTLLTFSEAMKYVWGYVLIPRSHLASKRDTISH
jgi:hypothetical protein